MEVLLDGLAAEQAAPGAFSPVHGREGADAQAGLRRSLRVQIARLEAQLADVTCEAFPEVLEPGPAPSRGAKVLDAEGLEEVRDRLAARLSDARSQVATIARRQEEARLRLERMLLDPAGSPGQRISQRELGEPGCGVWRSVPRLGIIGRMMGWWQVKLSSGCPLAT